MRETPKNTGPQRAVPVSATNWHLDAVRETTATATPDLDATQQRAAVTGATKVVAQPGVPATITLPVIPKEATQPKQPAILSPHQTRPNNAALSSHPTHPVTVVTPKFRTPDPHARPLPPRPGARGRAHRVAIATVVGALLVFMLTFVPVAHGAGASFPQWFTQSSANLYPTPTPVLYPSHPVVSGVGSFVCMALPFARLVQQEQAQDGLPHPWYVSVILAQWGVEQGWSIPSYTGYNWGNSSAIPGFPTIGGLNVPGSPGAFAYAYTPLQGVAIYETFTKMQFYVGVWQAFPNGPVAQAEALGQSPWDAGHYQEGGGVPGQSLLNAMNQFNLYRFDNPNVWC